MQSRGVVGKRIKRIIQNRRLTRECGGDVAVDVHAIELDDGTQIKPVVAETDFGEYCVEMIVVKPERAKA